MPQIKGSVLLGTLKYIKEIAGSSGTEAILDAMPAESLAVFERRVLASSWYPYAAYAALLQATDETLGEGDRSMMPAVGRFAAVQDFGSILRVISIFTSPGAVLDRATFFWNRYCDTGKSVLISRSKGEAHMALAEFPDVSLHHCHLLTGWIAGLGEQVGAKNSQVEKIACVHDGAPQCEYRGVWGQDT